MKRFLRNPNVIIGGGICLVCVVLALIGPHLTDQSPTKISVIERLSAPSAIHWLGTDALGRDIFSRIIYGLRLSLFVGAAVILICNIGGIFFGLIGGFSDRWGNLIMRLIDALMAFPGLILALGLVAVLGSRLENIIIALSVVYIPRVARIVHAIVLNIKTLEYIPAAEAIGAGKFRIMFVHLFPNTLGPVIIQASFLFANAVLAEASLSFLGVGLPSGTPSLGVILSEGRAHLLNAPWITIFPGIALFIIAMGLNIMGDGLRDLLDPRFR